ncbi:hypothetical protein SDRG_00593 [Saprolegnia diclina VS20]|uniref:Uncharacterized protein n=1 Tax=Saprolegnia diclina (strain VS20) TaxID=1156394 RepID=T0R8R7_SAPDV|nr:hypothetical protein SDRG_00593 [Saprolegnia diclina VS20]EQC42875.1 hypothetical protein SDRG_00593 [Saprolegnia diclina VS20]|eukprot:XP_008604298.1 hypothetical protein SDRG_00593 [Saprolegnia diclina VS20]
MRAVLPAWLARYSLDHLDALWETQVRTPLYYCAFLYDDASILRHLHDRGRLLSRWMFWTPAIRVGKMDVIAYLCSVADARAEPRLMATAAECGNLELVLYLAHQGCDATDALNMACKHGHLAIAQRLHALGLGAWDPKVLGSVASRGHLDVLCSLHDHGYAGFSSSTLTAAAANGHLDIVLFLCQHRHEARLDTALVAAATNGHVHVVRWLDQQTNASAVLRDRGSV